MGADSRSFVINYKLLIVGGGDKNGLGEKEKHFLGGSFFFFLLPRESVVGFVRVFSSRKPH